MYRHVGSLKMERNIQKCSVDGFLTMHLVALYEGLIILYVCRGVSDMCPNVFI